MKGRRDADVNERKSAEEDLGDSQEQRFDGT